MKTDVVTLFAALADPTRLRLLNLLNRGEVCVCFFVEVLRETQTKISRHLAYLRRAGIVAARRDGKWMHYRIVRPDDEKLAAVLDTTLQAISDERQMVRDRMVLERACCGIKLPPSLEHAPRPTLVAEGP
ncbi:MAG TPA: metalloregulator ArsR/SmtB family transcription factor [Thermoanaerobaculia bacterium]|nr:metalloregulator ArsR/SmtB family transcription factor [Thermoanaerobaculia bacterium]